MLPSTEIATGQGVWTDMNGASYANAAVGCPANTVLLSVGGSCLETDGGGSIPNLTYLIPINATTGYGSCAASGPSNAQAGGNGISLYAICAYD